MINKKIRFIQFFSFLFLGFFLLSSCHQNPFDIDIDKETVEMTLVRFDKELLETPVDSLENKVLDWDKRFPIFFAMYTRGVLQIGGVGDKAFVPFLIKFSNNNITQETYKDIRLKYASFDNEKKKIEKAFSYYHYYFPQKEIPRIFTIISGFNQSIAIDSMVMAIALDKYLGANDEFYERLAIPIYLRAKFRREFIPVDCMRAISWGEFPFVGEDNMANNMIYEGKIQYFLEAMLPFLDDTLKMGYTNKQMDWCYKNEKNLWTAVIEGEMLYQTKPIQIKNMIKEAPFSQPFGNHSPPKLGVWIGWQIVRSYMKNNPEISLKELMENNDYTAILNSSSYQP